MVREERPMATTFHFGARARYGYALTAMPSRTECGKTNPSCC